MFGATGSHVEGKLNPKRVGTSHSPRLCVCVSPHIWLLTHCRFGLECWSVFRHVLSTTITRTRIRSQPRSILKEEKQ